MTLADRRSQTADGRPDPRAAAGGSLSDRQSSAVRSRLSAISGRWSFVGGRLSAVGHQSSSPAAFEALGSRLGFKIVEETSARLYLVWRGPRFPAFLCLGIALALLFISVPIAQAIHVRGFAGPAGSLWYFPLMNVILFIISVYLLSQKRTIVIDNSSNAITLTRRSFHRITRLVIRKSEIAKLKLAADQVYNGFAVAGSSAAQSFPVPALRLVITGGESVLLDRGSSRRLKDLGQRISERIGTPLEIENS